MAKKNKKLTNKELLNLATMELIELTKQFRDGDTQAFERAKFPKLLKQRGLELGVTTNFIHRIFQGEFDNADGVEIGVKEAS